MINTIVGSIKELAKEFGGTPCNIQFTLGKNGTEMDFMKPVWQEDEIDDLNARLYEMGFKMDWQSDICGTPYRRYGCEGLHIDVYYKPNPQHKIDVAVAELEKLTGKKVTLGGNE